MSFPIATSYRECECVIGSLIRDFVKDMALGQWLGLTPPQIVEDTLHLSKETLSRFKKEKQYIVQGDSMASGS